MYRAKLFIKLSACQLKIIKILLSQILLLLLYHLLFYTDFYSIWYTI